jgi:hypothetical protein
MAVQCQQRYDDDVENADHSGVEVDAGFGITF